MLSAALLVVGLLAVALLWLYVTGARKDGVRASSEVGDENGEGADAAAEAGTGSVLLRDNVWSACAFDGLKEDWPRYAASPVRGFAGVPSGRHRVITTCPDGVATLDFVLYPGDVLARRLDMDAASWRKDEDALGAPTSLVGHRTVLGIARAMRGDAIVVPDDAVRRARASLDALFVRVGAEEPFVDLLRDATAIGDALVGVPLTRAQLGRLTGPIVKAAGEHAAAGEAERGARVVTLGLAVLPGDPNLLVHERPSAA